MKTTEITAGKAGKGSKMAISIDYLYQTALQWINHMLLCDEIRLKDIPSGIRISDTSIYVTALRISNKISVKRFIRDLSILCNDIYCIEKGEYSRGNLIDVLSTYLNINDHKGSEELENFTRDISESILCEMREYNKAVTEHIRKELTNQGYIKGSGVV